MTDKLREAIEMVFLDACVRLLDLQTEGLDGTDAFELANALEKAYPVVVTKFREGLR